MLIREMAFGDYDSVHDLWINTPGMGLNNVDDSREGIERFLLRNPNTCFVAIEGDALVGVILSGHDGRRGYIYHTSVALSKRNQGVGGALLRAALEAMEQEKICKVALVVFNRNEIGNRFWQNHGFTARDDLTYRNLAIKEFIRMDT